MGLKINSNLLELRELIRVFVSSSYSSEAAEETLIKSTIIDKGLYPVGMELNIESNVENLKAVRRLISESAYCLLIIGNQYSLQEFEYDYALSIGKPIIPFVYRCSGDHHTAKVDSTTADMKRLENFKRKVSENHLIAYFSNTDDLLEKISSHLPSLIHDLPLDNSSDMLDKKISEKFEDAATPFEIIDALDARAMGKQNKIAGITRYACHYTRMSAVSAIVKSKKWYLGSPKSMNDGLELIHLEDANADNLFFASFSLGNTENIGMWSMYAQPWEDGVLLRIPIAKIKVWVNSDCKIYDANKTTKKAGSEIIDAKFSFHAVAYTNAESKDPSEPEVLSCGTNKNTLFKDIFNHPLLKGYIKDSAWAYENEYRIRVETNPNEQHDAVAIDIPQDVLDSFEFITGPRFTRNFTAVLRNEAGARLKPIVKESLFTGRLKWVYCDSCGIKAALYHRQND